MAEATTERKPFIAVNSSPAMSGHFATLYNWSLGEGGVDIHGKAFEPYWFAEPYESGMGRYADWRDANAEGERWAAEVGLEFHPATEESVARAAASAERFRLRLERRHELVRGGMAMKEAYRQAKEEFPDPQE
jgi:hypothetical protein